ncbi:MAG: hypothetical protein LQ351_000305 [Letrouitia transgressa]|nr:MAG: hypothetical protein LQ351_000305 [Letrouitia transgressa]
MVDIAQRPPSFPPRLPTPPKENNDRLSKLGDGQYLGTLGQSVLLDTPDDSPSSSAENSRSSGDRHPKRVIFSPWNKMHNPPNLSTPTALTEAVIKRLPPSRECIAQNKSILKASTTVDLATDRPLLLSLNPGDSMITMLHSIMQQLKSSSRDSRFDSYMTLLGCLSAYEEVPDTKTLMESMTGLTEFIRRDVSAILSETGLLDSQLATQALKVLTVVLQSNDLSEAVPDGFRHFIADRAVSSVENQSTPRTMVDHYMHLIGRQKFSTKVMNADRINRTLTAIRGMESRIKGSRVIGLKLAIYQRFLTQARHAMISRAEEWLECLVASLLSPAKEIRARAIAFGTEAGLCLGATAAVSQACVDLLNRVTPAGNKPVHALGNRLVDLLAKRDDAVDAPQIWAIPILFLRAKPRQLERWEHLKRWIVIMQRCLNSSDEKTRQQANVSWNRLICVTSPDLSTDIIMTRMLRQPILAQLNRKSNDKASKYSKQVARSTYCNLLYYAFRPGSPHSQLDLFWEEYVMGVIGNQSSTSKSDLHFASEIVAAMLSSSQPRVWDQDRANQPNAMRPEELPCLDSKWVRSKAKAVLAFFSHVLERSGWQLDQDSSSNVLLVWQSFAKALGEAASKEVKVSAETMNAVAQIVSTIKRFVQHNGKGNRGDAEPVQAVVMLVQEAIAKIGVLPFMEKRLTQNSSEDLFEVAETPSKRRACHLESVNSPIAHILKLLVCNVQNDQVKENHRLAIGEFIEIALRGSTSRRAQLSVLRELSKLKLPADATFQRSKILLWQQIAQYAGRALASPNSRESQGKSPQFLSHDYAEVISILDDGLRQTSDEVFEPWKRLTTAATQELRNGCGEKEVWRTVTEPLSTAIQEEASRGCNSLLIQCGTLMLETFQWPESCQTSEQVRELLWGSDASRNKAYTAEPLGSFYAMIGDLLAFNYSYLQSMPPDVSVNLILAISRFILSCPLALRIVVLQRVQNQLTIWVEDDRELLRTPAASPRTEGLLNAVSLQPLMDTRNSSVSGRGSMV